jgi:uncharacterized protein YecT (DUF1311 family)
MSKTEIQLREDRERVVDKMTAALANNDMEKFDKLNTEYQKLSEKIKGKKNG